MIIGVSTSFTIRAVLLVIFNKIGNYVNQKFRKPTSEDSDSFTTYYHNMIHSPIQQIFLGNTLYATYCVRLENTFMNKLDKAQVLTDFTA